MVYMVPYRRAMSPAAFVRTLPCSSYSTLCNPGTVPVRARKECTRCTSQMRTNTVLLQRAHNYPSAACKPIDFEQIASPERAARVASHAIRGSTSSAHCYVHAPIIWTDESHCLPRPIAPSARPSHSLSSPDIKTIPNAETRVQ